MEWRQLQGGVYKADGSFKSKTNLYSGRLDPGSVLVVFGEGASLTMDTLLGSMKTTGWLGFEHRIQGWQCMTVRDWFFGPLYPTMTVEEQVRSLVRFRKHGGELDSIVNQMLNIFDLSDIREEKVGHSKIPEQFDTRRKKIILAMRLSLLCPLNLLYDSFTDLEYEDALEVMGCLKRYAEETGLSVVVSVEDVGTQQVKLVELADKIMIASHSGKLMFYGTLRESTSYFRELGYDVGDVVSLAQLVHLDLSGPQRYMETFRQVTALEDSWSTKFPHEEPPSYSETNPTTPPLLPIGQQYKMLIRRCALMFRDRPALVALFIQSTVPILLLSFIFFRKPLDAFLGLTIRSSLFFSLSINNTFSVAVPEALFFRAQYQQVEWEAGTYKLYRAWLVPFVRLSVILPFRMSLVILLTVPLYFITGLRTDNIIHFFIFEGVILLNTMVAAIIGILIGAWTPSIEVTQLATVLIIDIFILFGGLGSPGNNPSWIIRWVQYLSPIYYTFRAMLRNELVGQSKADWVAYLRSVEIERLTAWWAVGGLALLGTSSLVLLLLHTTRI